MATDEVYVYVCMCVLSIKCLLKPASKNMDRHGIGIGKLHDSTLIRLGGATSKGVDNYFPCSKQIIKMIRRPGTLIWRISILWLVVNVAFGRILERGACANSSAPATVPTRPAAAVCRLSAHLGGSGLAPYTHIHTHTHQHIKTHRHTHTMLYCPHLPGKVFNLGELLRFANRFPISYSQPSV